MLVGSNTKKEVIAARVNRDLFNIIRGASRNVSFPRFLDLVEISLAMRGWEKKNMRSSGIQNSRSDKS